MGVKHFDNFDECIKEYERVRPWILKVIERSTDGLKEYDILARIGQRKLYLMTLENAFALYSFHNSDGYNGFAEALKIPDPEQYFLLHMVGGETNNSLRDILNCSDEIENYVRERGFKTIKAIGRKGWKRIIEPYGYSTEKYNEFENIYTKEVI